MAKHLPLLVACSFGLLKSKYAHASALSSIISLHDGNFDQTNVGEWAVEFYAPWCTHCRQLEPIWIEVANKLGKEGSKVKIAKLDATLNPTSAKHQKVKAYPTIQFLRDGVTIAEYGSHARDKESISKWILSLETKSHKSKFSGPCLRNNVNKHSR